ncbi:hypothetical protein GGX14DRAFT_571502 [Mycena pura]|uniref:Retrotransposon gag domain-containing protein n=1 Tax=Mycena pura TaxID=153505 RepID=A0AAD6Y4S6_9AGAR|nr:hypothetical protein GGX14DRAFT_571502 [Mycena pura]
MVFIVEYVQTSQEAAVPGAAFDGAVEDTMERMVRTILASLLTPVAETRRSRRIHVTFDMVWMGEEECFSLTRRSQSMGPQRHEMSRSAYATVDDLAAQRLEMSRSRFGAADGSAATRHEMSRVTADDSAANGAERHEASGGHHTAGTSAAECHGNSPVGPGGVSGFAAEGELQSPPAASGMAQHRWSYELMAGSAPTSIIDDGAAEMVSGCDSRSACDLGARVDTGPSRMYSARSGISCGTDTAERCLIMEDWNDLLESDDPFGPLPSWSKIRARDTLFLPEIAAGRPLMAEFLDALKEEPAIELQSAGLTDACDVESVDMSQATAETEEPLILCGMARIRASTNRSYSDGSDSERRAQNSHQPPHRSKGTSKHEVLPKAKESRQKSYPRSCKTNVESFKRKSSEIPDGRWFTYRATTAPSTPSASSAEDESSSPSASLSKGRSRKHHRQRQNKTSHARSDVKIKKPFTYDGKADLDIFDQWTYEVDTWKEWNRISDRDAVMILVNFMSGKASKFFMKHVALRQCSWTPKSIYEALFNYCFPPDFKLKLRDELTSAKQGKRDVRDFQRDLETLAVRFPDVTERQIRQIFWDGLQTYL